jgi:hypothetical protein
VINGNQVKILLRTSITIDMGPRQPTGYVKQCQRLVWKERDCKGSDARHQLSSGYHFIQGLLFVINPSPSALITGFGSSNGRQRSHGMNLKRLPFLHSKSILLFSVSHSHQLFRISVSRFETWLRSTVQVHISTT